MEGAGFRSLIIFLLLAILAFVAGSLASENAVGALAPTGIILGLFFLIYLGKNCWVLVFIVPPLLSVLGVSLFRNFPISYVICDVVLFYMIILYMMGYIKIRWNGLLFIDLCALIFVLYIVSTYIRHPVTMKILTNITDFGYANVGGKEYLYLIAVSLCYITISLLDVNFNTIKNIFKWSFFLSLGATVFICLKGIVTGSITLGEEVSNSRFGAFSGIGTMIIQYVFAKYSLIGIILSPAKLVLIVVAFGCVALSGFRTLLISSVLYTVCASIVHKQLCLYILLGLTAWGSLVYLSNENEHLLDDLPHGIQRALTVVPGIVVNDEAVRSAQTSSEWRKEMWKWAFDPSTGYIKDYVWGDGYGQSLYEEKLRETAISLGLYRSGDAKLFAARGVWHNGAIECMHRLGLVGLAIAYIFVVIVVCFTLKVCFILRPFEGAIYISMCFLGLFERLFTIWFLPINSLQIINMLYLLAVAKLVYSCIKREYPEYIKARTGEYVPLIVDEYRHTNSVA